jgi:hypothetical protein
MSYSLLKMGEYTKLDPMFVDGYSFIYCGVCLKDCGLNGLVWSNPISRVAHPTCLDDFKKIEAKFLELFSKIPQSKTLTEIINGSHRKVIRHVQKACGGLSIKTYQKKNGRKKLQEIFDSVWIAAVDSYISTKEKTKKISLQKFGLQLPPEFQQVKTLLDSYRN